MPGEQESEHAGWAWLKRAGEVSGVLAFLLAVMVAFAEFSGSPESPRTAAPPPTAPVPAATEPVGTPEPRPTGVVDPEMPRPGPSADPSVGEVTGRWVDVALATARRWATSIEQTAVDWQRDSTAWAVFGYSMGLVGLCGVLGFVWGRTESPGPAALELVLLIGFLWIFWPALSVAGAVGAVVGCIVATAASAYLASEVFF